MESELDDKTDAGDYIFSNVLKTTGEHEKGSNSCYMTQRKLI